MGVRENRLSDPSLVAEADYLPFVEAGSTWVAESGACIVGFAAAAQSSASVWALFVDPEAEGAGVGGALLETLLDWARERGLERMSLTTSPGTRADTFYRRRGWCEVGVTADGEVMLERAIEPIQTR